MARKIFTSEQIIGKLREAEVLLSQGQPLGTVCRGLGVSEMTYYRWRGITVFRRLCRQEKPVIQNTVGCVRTRRTVSRIWNARMRASRSWWRIWR